MGRDRALWCVTLGLLALGCGGEVHDDGADAGDGRDARVGSDAAGPRDAGAEAGSGDAGSDASAAGPDAGPPPCELAVSPPIVVETEGAVVENLRIDADGVPAIRVRASGVTVRNVSVTHVGAAGIEVSGADDVTLTNVAVEYLGAPEVGANPSAEHVNVRAYRAARLTVEGARLRRGSSGIYLLESPSSVLRDIQGEDFRGPFPRGQLVQWNASDDGLLEGFSNVNPPSSWPEDNVNVYRSANVIVRRGLLDGNNSPSGVGVIFDGGDSAIGRVEDVDAIRMGNGCFSAYAGGDGSVFLRTRCRDNVCTGRDGRDPPSSNGLMWAGQPGLGALRIEGSAYFAACNPGNIVWPRDSFEVVEVREEDFAPRAALDLRFCWE